MPRTAPTEGGPVSCKRCGAEDIKVFPDGHCGFCQCTLARRISVVGTDAMALRMSTMNPQRDTMRAIEYIAKTDNRISKAELRRWQEDARRLPDVNTPMSGAEIINNPGPPAEIQHQVEEREIEGGLKHLWDEAHYERAICKRKPENEVQAKNYAMVDAWEGKSTQ